MLVALYTFGQFLLPSEDQANDGFHALNDAVLREIENSPGFVARSGYESDPGPESWGPETYPRFYKNNGDGWAPATLSLWRDLHSPLSATYSGLHNRAFKRGHKWFQRGNWPPLVLWWVEDTHKPTWAEGASRLEYLHDNGPTCEAFTFRRSFAVDGRAFTPETGSESEADPQNPLLG